MTVSMQVSKRIYAGNGVTRKWDVDFPLASPQDVRVYVTSPAGAETELAEDFELNAAGTELEYPTLSSGKPPLAAGWSLTLERHTPLTQEIDLLRQGELDAEVLESGYDKLTLLVQELNEKVSRSIKYPVSTIVDDLETDSFLRNILSIKQDALNASSAAVSSAQQAQASASSAQQTAQSALAAIASSQASAQSDIAASGAAVENTLQTYLSAAQNEAQTARYYAERSIGKTVGEVYYSQSAAEADNPGALPLFTGETIASASTLYPDFYAWLQNHSGLTCTAAEYEAALTAYGECPKYVLADGSLRLPLLKHYIKCANTTDGITQKKAGLPNHDHITHAKGAASGNYITNTNTGWSGGGGAWFGGQASVDSNVRTGDASENNSVYGASDTVTPAHTTLYPWVFAFSAAVPASTAQASAFQQSLTGKADTNLANIASNIDYIVESYLDEDGNWYCVWKSGRIEQGGIGRAVQGGNLTTFLKPYQDTKYTLIISQVSESNTGVRATAGFQKTATSFLSVATEIGVDYSWYASGKGA